MSVLASVINGSGGCSKVWQRDDDLIPNELQAVIGFKPFPGTLNLETEHELDWDRPHRKYLQHDLKDRVTGQGWVMNPFRAYPVKVNGAEAWVLKVEDGIWFPAPRRRVMEVAAAVKLRDVLGLKTGDLVTVEFR